MHALKYLIMDNQETKSDLQVAVIKMKDLWNQTKPYTPNNNRTHCEDQSISHVDTRGGRGRGQVGHYSNRGGSGHRSRGHRGSSYSNCGSGRRTQSRSDYIPTEVLESLTPQQRRFMLQGRDTLRRIMSSP